MSLSIRRYKNYGCQMFADAEKESDVAQKFYWCFFELSNDKVICVLNTGTWSSNNEFLDWEIDSTYDFCYQFGEEFESYWERHWDYTDKHINAEMTSKEEHDLVCDYYEKHLRL